MNYLAKYLSNYIWIAVGAVIGASARYFLSSLMAQDFSSAFPYGTLLINITGSLVLGFFLVFSTARALHDPRWRLLVAIAFCPSFGHRAGQPGLSPTPPVQLYQRRSLGSTMHS